MASDFEANKMFKKSNSGCKTVETLSTVNILNYGSYGN